MDEKLQNCPVAVKEGRNIVCPIAVGCMRLLDAVKSKEVADSNASSAFAVDLIVENKEDFLKARNEVGKSCIFTNTESLFKNLPQHLAGLVNLFMIGVTLTPQSQKGWSQFDGMPSPKG